MKIFFSIVAIITAQISTAYAEGNKADTNGIWTIYNVFSKRLDAGYLAGDPVDIRHPPTLELIFLAWDGKQLSVSGSYYNLTAKPVKVKGREIAEPVIGTKQFYPYATLEVSNKKDREWKAIGRSPFPKRGTVIVVSMRPNSLETDSLSLPPNSSCVIDMDAFRPFISKVKYGRVVLDGGGFSQVLDLTDLLPGKHFPNSSNGKP